MRIGIIQLCCTDDPTENLNVTLDFIKQAAEDGAELVLTPEVTNLVSTSRNHQQTVLQLEEADITLAEIKKSAKDLGISISLGSLAVKTKSQDGRFANRSFLINRKGEVQARYDKIHMFDAFVSDKETYEESKGYKPGSATAVCEIDKTALGLSICYDLRFPHLYRDLAKAGAGIITVPAAMSPVTGEAHIEVLLRARAIETGCFMVMPSQSGQHKIRYGKPRETWGHSMVVDPWGKVILDMSEGIGFKCLDLDLSLVKEARRKIQSLSHDHPYTKPVYVR